jgi:hypothetical protein
MIGRLAAAYFGGAVGALANSLAAWLLGRAGIFAAMGVSLRPAFTWEWLENRLLWGGLFGLGYPRVKRLGLPPVRTGLLLSLVPTAVQLFYFYPRAGDGLGGLDRGLATPLVSLLLNLLWGWVLARTAVAAGHG